MVNRSAVILKYKEPFITWINESDPYKKDMAITEDKANDDRTVYLITEEDSEHLENWLSLNFAQLFGSLPYQDKQQQTSLGDKHASFARAARSLFFTGNLHPGLQLLAVDTAEGLVACCLSLDQKNIFFFCFLVGH